MNAPMRKNTAWFPNDANTSCELMIPRRGSRRMIRRAVTGRGSASVTQYHADMTNSAIINCPSPVRPDGLGMNAMMLKITAPESR